MSLFYTVDHKLQSVGLVDVGLNWFHSDLTGRTHPVADGPLIISNGMPQGLHHDFHYSGTSIFMQISYAPGSILTQTHLQSAFDALR